jgi:quinol monooxygenase YgiN
MATTVTLLADMAIRPGKADEFRAFVKRLVEVTRSEPGTLVYEYFVADDGRSVQIFERYTDSAAAATHLQAFGSTYAKDFFETVEPQSLVVLGDPDESVRTILDGPTTRYLDLLDGFARGEG